MQALILAGGLGTRLSELTDELPKPMVRIGTFPILLHIMSHFSYYGVSDFIILGGYKFHKINEYFEDINPEVLRKNEWRVKVLDSGLSSTTAGRILYAKPWVQSEFFLTYGDGLSDINVSDLYKHHTSQSSCVTVTAVHPPPRFGALEISHSGLVTRFKEKDNASSGWINGGFFCMNSEVFDYIIDEDAPFEGSNMENLVSNGQLNAYRHQGFWSPMDTLRDKRYLDGIVSSGNTPWNSDCLGSNS